MFVLGLAASAVALVLLVGVDLREGGASQPAGATVVSVRDGDTLTLSGGTTVRLVQIDAPEVSQRECHADAARATLLALAPLGSRVTLAGDPVLDEVDRYGRLLRYVKREGLNVNLELVRRGAAAPYFYRGERGRYAGQLLEAAHVARRAKRGIWSTRYRTRLDPERQVETGRCGSRSGGTPPPTILPVVPPAPGACDPNYGGACVPPPPPDLDCDDLRSRGLDLPVLVRGKDPHRLDGDGDGYGCE